jgi:hypothetical protein
MNNEYRKTTIGTTPIGTMTIGTTISGTIED